MRLDKASPSGARTVGTPVISIGTIELCADRSDQRQLLIVLFAEEHTRRRDDVEQFQDDGAYTVEVSRPMRTAQNVRETRDGDQRVAVAAVRIHFAFAWCEQYVSVVFEQCGVVM